MNEAGSSFLQSPSHKDTTRNNYIIMAMLYNFSKDGEVILTVSVFVVVVQRVQILLHLKERVTESRSMQQLAYIEWNYS